LAERRRGRSRRGRSSRRCRWSGSSMVGRRRGTPPWWPRSARASTKLVMSRAATWRSSIARPGAIAVVGGRSGSHEPANSDVDVGLAHQLAVMHDTAKQACEHEADCDLGIDAGPTIVEAIQVGNFIPQPRKVENTIDAHEHMVIRNELS